MIKNKRVLITGGAGSIGGELTRQLVLNNKVYILDINETECFDLIEELKQAGHWIHGRVGNIEEESTVRDVFSDFKPEIVFHAAARKHVTPMEWFPIEAIRTNVVGLYNVLQASKVYPVEKFVFISTDKAISPDSIMGATKRLGEIMVKNQGEGYVVVRFGNVLGSRGSLIPIWQNQVDRGKPITVTDTDMERYFMTIPEACSLVLEAAQEGQGGEIIILDMGERVNIYNLAKGVIDQLRNKVPIEVIGKRPGEKMVEVLMTDEEQRKAIKKDNFWVIK